MRKLFLIIFFFVVCAFAKAQYENLVLNPSLEELSDSNYSIFWNNSSVNYWFGGTRYFHHNNLQTFYQNICGFNRGLQYKGNPLNDYGFQLPKTGLAYSLIGAVHYLYNGSNPVYIYLCGTLNKKTFTNKKYHISFFLSRTDSLSNYATDDICVYFSKNAVFGSFDVIPVNPQFCNGNNNYITDALGWQEISGDFIANGNEQYFTIGIFKDFNNIDTLFVGSYYSPDCIKGIYYYLDDVSVTFCDTIYKAQAGNDTTICNGGTAILGVHNFSDYHYKWSPSTGLNNDTLANPIATPSVTTTYNLELKDFFDTITYDEIVVSVNPCLPANAGENRTICFGESTILGSNALAGFQYQWSPTNGLDNALVANPTATLWQTTNYYLTQTAPNGVVSNDSVLISVVNCDTIFAYAGEDKSICKNESTQIGTAAINGVVYQWSPCQWLSNCFEATPIAKPEGDISYVLMLQHKNFAITYDTITISTLDCYIPDSTDMMLFLPNAFTPNGDGVNDIFTIYVNDNYDIKVNIYDRWGRIIYKLNNKNETWNGKYTDGSIAQQGIYTCEIKIYNNNKLKNTQIKKVSLIR